MSIAVPATSQGRGLILAALAVAAIGTGLSVLGALTNSTQFMWAYLIAYVFWVGLALGCMTLVMIHHLVGGAWSTALLRVLEAGAATMPLLALLFIPLLFGLSDLYPWALPEAVAADPMLDRQHVYMNAPFFIARAVLYLVLWVLLAYGLRRWATARERTADPKYTVYLRRLSAGGLVILAFTVTFAMIDWVMSLEPHWHSSIHPAVIAIGALLGAFALGVGVTALLAARAQGSRALVTQVRTDLGGMFVGFAILWAYLAYSQFLLVWTGDLPEEVRWYQPRIEGGWEWLAIGVVGGQLVLPMALLVPRRLRLDTRVLGLVALGVLLAHALDVFWLIAPAHGDTTPSLHWVEASLLCAIGGMWAAAFLWRLGRHHLVDEELISASQDPLA